jgi:hypothetical protein
MAEMSPARKRIAIAFVAIGVALIVQRTLASSGDAEPDVVAPAKAAAPRADAPAPAASAPTPLHLERLATRQTASAAAPASDALFAVQSWQPAAPPAPPSAEPVEPAVPAFPYASIGGLTDERGRIAFFAQGERVLALREGETVDGNYRVDHLDETQMTLTYLPFQKTVAVRLGGGR